MNNAYIIDFNLLQEQGLLVEEFLMLIYLVRKEEDVYSEVIMNSLQDKGFIKIIDEDSSNEYIIREKGKLLLELVTIEGGNKMKERKVIIKSSRRINNELDDFIEEFRNLWKGLKPGSMGSANEIRNKMFRWMKENPSYTKQDIINAAKRYLKTLEGDYKYLQQADYFIFKGESSRLSAFIDEEDIRDDGWSSELK